MSKQRAKGTAAETAIVNYLKEQGFHALRLPLHGANDQGDLYIFGKPVVVEVKNCAKMTLSEWVKEAQAERDNAQAKVGVVYHKKKGTTDPAKWYVTMAGEDFARLLQLIQ